MGQYFYLVNIDKEQYLHPHSWNEGVKLGEFTYPFTSSMLMTAFALLLTDGNGQGGGDYAISNPLVGSWAYDRVVIAGDYAKPYTKIRQARPEAVWNDVTESWENGPDTCANIYDIAASQYREISMDIFLAMIEDPYLAGEYRNHVMNDVDTWYRNWDAPTMLITLAYALKSIESLPVLGNKAAWAFRTLFGDGQEYYRYMNGLIKHHRKTEQYRQLSSLELLS